jgi:type I restriction enzyme, S subunit
MKNGWPNKTVADVSQVFADGDWVESKDQSTGGIRLIQTGNVGEGVFKNRAEKARYISEQTFNRLRCTEIFEGDCLISRLPDPVGRSCILPNTGEKMITAVDCTIVRFDRKQLLPEFFNFYSQSLDYLRRVDAETTGTTRKRISRSKLGEVMVPLPPLPEQQRIVGVLDEAFEGIATAKANAEKNLQNARALFESHLQSVFTQRGKGWKRVQIEEVCESIMDCINKTAPKADGPTPFKMIRTTNVRNGRIDLESVNYVTEDVYRIWTRRQVPKLGDVILTREAPMGEVGMLLKEDNVFLGQRLVSYRANPMKLTNRFLLYALQSVDLQSQISALASGSTVQHMRVPDSKKLQLPLPDLDEQECAVATLDKVREDTKRLESIYQQKLAALEALKKSLLHQAFTGKL